MKRIGKYEILGQLGQGGMGVVYKGHDTIIDRDVAIKVVHERALDAPSIKKRFYREAQSAGRLSHENITIIYDVGEENGKPYIVMEYLEGDDLRRILDARVRLSLAGILSSAFQRTSPGKRSGRPKGRPQASQRPIRWSAKQPYRPPKTSVGTRLKPHLKE